MEQHQRILRHIREIFGRPEGFIPLHEPLFTGNERKYVLEAIDSTFVSSVGEFVDRFESRLCEATGASHAVATVNGTSALHAALVVAGVGPGDLAVTQPTTFVATANAVAYCGADPLLLDVDAHTMGLSPEALSTYLERHCRIRDNACRHKKTGRRVAACIPMHTFGHPCRIDEIAAICDLWSIPVVEDAAESMGSIYKGKKTGLFGRLGVLSFNGNKIITAGGGGAILTNSSEMAERAKHLTTTAKRPHPYEYIHDETGYNYRMPNLNAALACAQLERLEDYIANKRELAEDYRRFFDDIPEMELVLEPPDSRANYWLNSILLPDKENRDAFLTLSNASGVMTRPMWQLLHRQPMYRKCLRGDLSKSEMLERRLVNIPSSVRGL